MRAYAKALSMPKILNINSELSYYNLDFGEIIKFPIILILLFSAEIVIQIENLRNFK